MLPQLSVFCTPFRLGLEKNSRQWAEEQGLGARCYQAAEKLAWRVIPRSPPFLLADDEESRIVSKTLRARFLAPLGMTAWKGFSAPCKAPPFRGSQIISVINTPKR